MDYISLNLLIASGVLSVLLRMFIFWGRKTSLSGKLARLKEIQEECLVLYNAYFGRLRRSSEAIAIGKGVCHLLLVRDPFFSMWHFLHS